MPSDAQLRANRANAQKSTGPRTPEGKDRSRLNATTHNITGLASLRTGPEQDAFDAYFVRLLPGFNATSDLEHELASRIIDVMFRLARISTLEVNILAVGDSEAEPAVHSDDPVAHALAQAKNFIRDSRALTNLSLYEQRLSRTLAKDLDTLQRLQHPKPSKDSNNPGRAAKPPRPDVIRFGYPDPDKPGEFIDTLSPIYLPREEAHSPASSIGFVFSAAKNAAAPPGLTL